MAAQQGRKLNAVQAADDGAQVLTDGARGHNRIFKTEFITKQDAGIVFNAGDHPFKAH